MGFDFVAQKLFREINHFEDFPPVLFLKDYRR